MPDDPTPTKVSEIALTAITLADTDKFVGNKLVDGQPKTHVFPYTLFKAVTDAISSALAALTSVVDGKAAAVHTHIPSEVGLSNVSNVDATQRANHTGTQAQSTIVDLVGDLAAKAAAGHTHDDRYYTEAELDALLVLKAALNSPAFTGSPTAPTATSGTNTTQLATTAFVKTALDNLIAGAPGALDTLLEISTAITNGDSAVAALTGVVATKAATNQKLDDFGTPDDNTDLNATTSRHGLLPKLGGGSTNFFRADGTWAAPPAGGGGAFARGDAVVQGHTTGASPATSPPQLVFTFTETGPAMEGYLTLNFDGTDYTIYFSPTDPSQTFWVDTTSLLTDGEMASAVASVVGTNIIGVTANDMANGGGVSFDNSATGTASSSTGVTQSGIYGSTTGGGSGSDAVPASGAVAEATIIPFAISKGTKAVRVGCVGAGVGVSVQLALKTAGGLYSQLGTFGSGTTSGELLPTESTLGVWLVGVAETDLVARMVDEEGNNIAEESIPEGGSLQLWAIAEQVL